MCALMNDDNNNRSSLSTKVFENPRLSWAELAKSTKNAPHSRSRMSASTLGGMMVPEAKGCHNWRLTAQTQ